MYNDMTEETSPLRPLIRDLQPGQAINFPIRRMQTVKTTCTDLGAIYCRKFRTKINRDQGVITVTRTQ